MKAKCILFIFLASFSCLAFSGVYKQIDKDGNVTYTNVRSHDAKKVDLPPIVVVPKIDSQDIDTKIKNRRESTKNNEQRETIERKISEESARLDEVKQEYKNGEPDRLGSERNYQRYLDRVERLKEEITIREKNLETLKQELKNIPGPSKPGR